ncbi:MAG TPA: hypothetical protein VG796_00565 [Verrucomicrobiales bacterium]|nr:hypothetical protein [Verrucomicrobiales bacterium]
MKKLTLTISGIAGVLTSFALPLPSNKPAPLIAEKESASPAHPAVPRTIIPPARDWPSDASAIAHLSAGECAAALDKILRRFACATPDSDTLDIATALTLRLNAAGHVLPGRRLPGWLITAVTRSLTKDSPVPPASWMAIILQSSEARGALIGLTAELAAVSPDKAKALADACPAAWKEPLDAKQREGLAVRDPVAAARTAWEATVPYGVINSDSAWSCLRVSSKHGPVRETVAALALYGSPGGYPEILTNLHRRDPEAVRAAVEATDDPGLRKALNKIAEGVPDDRDKSRLKALEAAAAIDPNEALRAWSAASGERTEESRHMVAGMIRTDPGRAFEWAKTNAPQELATAFQNWMLADGPAALHAILTLTPGDPLRDEVLRSAARPPDPREAALFDAANSSRRGTFRTLMLWPDITAEIKAAARYVKLPPPPAPAPAAGSSLWDDSGR